MLDFLSWFTTTQKESRVAAKADFAAMVSAAGGGLRVFKQANGKYRWLAISSNAFVDGDKEIVSTKALNEDADRVDARGPLRWWHEPQLDLGDADFGAMHGRMLIESGTFRSPEIAMRVAEKVKELSMSVGFVHPMSEPDSDGVFHNIKIFERSLLPKERASNRFTNFEIVEDKDMNEMKFKALKELVGDALVEKIISGAEISEKEAMSEGLRYKEASENPASYGTEAVLAEIRGMPDDEVLALMEQVISEKNLGGAEDAAGETVMETTKGKFVLGKKGVNPFAKKGSAAVDDEEAEMAAGVDDDETAEAMKKTKKKELSGVATKGMGMQVPKPTTKMTMGSSKKAESEMVDAEDDEEVAAADEMAAEEDLDEAEVMAVSKSHSKKHGMKNGMAKKKKALGGDPDDDDDDDLEAVEDVGAEDSDEEDDVDAEEEVEGESELEQDEVAYMSPTELADLLTTTIGEVVSELGVTEKMQAVTKELRVIKRVINEMDERLTASSKNVTTKEKNTATLLARLEKMDVRLKELEGETPKAFTKGYRSSQDGGTEIEEGHRLKEAKPADDPLDHFRLFLNGNKNN